MSRIILAILICGIFAGCNSDGNVEKGSAEYIKEINDWHKAREERLTKENGWLNLAGLYWLEEGENSFGAGEGSDIVFPVDTPETIGKFILKDSVVTVEIQKDVPIFIDSQEIKSAELHPDISGKAEVMSLNSLRWFLIKRGEDKYGIRLRDLNSEKVKNFEGVERFPVNEDWKIEAEYIPFDEPKKINIPTIIGTVEEDFAPGKLTFNKNGEEYTILPTSAGEGLFIIFADETSGEETYGAGRFLYVAGPDSSNIVELDFNKAYNPPCAFTKYATCPLPPKENYLKLRITAGEKNYGHSH